MFIRLPEPLFNKVAEISESLGKSVSDCLTEMLEQAARAYELSCSLKDAVDLRERTMKEKKEVEEDEIVETPSVPEVFERMLASKLRPDIVECGEYERLSKFLSQL